MNTIRIWNMSGCLAEVWLLSPSALAVVAGAFFAAAVVGALFWRRAKVLLRFLAGLLLAWLFTLISYGIARPAEPYFDWLRTSEAATVVIGATGGLLYVWSLFSFHPEEMKWHRCGPLLAGLALLIGGSLRSGYQPAISCYVQWPAAGLCVATVWRFRSEPLVHLAIAGLLVGGLFTANKIIAPDDEDRIAKIALTVAAMSGCLAVLGVSLSRLGRREGNPRWYQQALLFVPLVAVALSAAVGAGLLVGQGMSPPIALMLALLSVVLLLVSVAFCQMDLFGFFGMSFTGAMVALYALADAGEISSTYMDRYATVCLASGYGLALASAVLKTILRDREKWQGFAKALYISAVASAFAAAFSIPLRPVPGWVGVDALLIAGVVLLGHLHSTKPFINFAAGVLAGAAAYLLLGNWSQAGQDHWVHLMMLLTAGLGIAFLLASLALREFLRRICGTSDRMSRRQSTPLTVLGMLLTLGLAAWLMVQEVRVYADLLREGESAILPMLGPGAGFVAWLGVLAAFLISMWLFRLTFRTFLFYVFGICVTCFIGFFSWTDTPYRYLIYAIGGYGSAHLLVYLHEAKFMAFLARFCNFYRDERQASTLIFTLAAISCLVGAGLAALRLDTYQALIMLGIESAVFLAWAFVWQRGVMLYPAILVVTLGVISIWHNIPEIGPSQTWDAYRLTTNAAILSFSALFWLGIGSRLEAIRGSIFHLASPARNSSVILGLVAAGFAIVLALCPTFNSHLWEPESGWRRLTMGVITLGALVAYWSWASLVFRRRFYSVMAALCLITLGVYLGLRIG